MNFKAYVPYKGGIAYYLIQEVQENHFAAELTRYDGKSINHPINRFSFTKIGNEWVSKEVSPLLLKEVTAIIEKKVSISLALNSNNHLL